MQWTLVVMVCWLSMVTSTKVPPHVLHAMQAGGPSHSPQPLSSALPATIQWFQKRLNELQGVPPSTPSPPPPKTSIIQEQPSPVPPPNLPHEWGELQPEPVERKKVKHIDTRLLQSKSPFEADSNYQLERTGAIRHRVRAITRQQQEQKEPMRLFQPAPIRLQPNMRQDFVPQPAQPYPFKLGSSDPFLAQPLVFANPLDFQDMGQVDMNKEVEHKDRIIPTTVRAVQEPTPVATTSTITPFHLKPIQGIQSIDYNAILGRGGFGMVYKGKDISGDEVAVKVISHEKMGCKHHVGFCKKMIHQFIASESVFCPELQHVNVVQCKGAFADLKANPLLTVYILTELCDGGDLLRFLMAGIRHKSLQGNPYLQVPFDANLFDKQAQCYFWQFIRGLHFLHKRQIAHRDIKPGNLFLTQKGFLKIGDFGMATRTNATGWTQFKSMLGTPSHVAPELFAYQNHPPVMYNALAADIFAAGITYFQLRFFQSPWEKASLKDPNFARYFHQPSFLLHQMKSGRPDIQDVEVHLVLGMLTRSPASRYTTGRILENRHYQEMAKYCSIA